MSVTGPCKLSFSGASLTWATVRKSGDSLVPRPGRLIIASASSRASLVASSARLERDVHLHLAIRFNYRSEGHARRCPSLRGPRRRR
jgi:hypothetical protein